MQRKTLSTLLALIVLGGAMSTPLLAAPVHFSQTLTTYNDCDVPFLTADLNNDGRADIVSISQCRYGTTPTFSTRLSTGNGTFSTSEQSYTLPPPADGNLGGLFVGDFNNDGAADVGVIANAVYIYLNDGHGNLALKNTLALPPFGVAAVGDFNHDRNMDIAYVGSGQLYVLFGDGKDNFTTGPITPVNFDTGGALLAGDFDGDGMADLAISDLINYTSPTVLYGDNTGHFVPVTLTTSPMLLRAGDVNSDGRTDLIGIPYNPSAPPGSYINVLYGNVARTFANRTTIPFKAPVQNVAVADMDGNGLNDLIVSEYVTNTYYTTYVGVRTRNPDSSYNAEQTILTPTASEAQYGGVYEGPWIVNADQNSKPDVAIGVCKDDECLGTNYYTLMNTTTGNFPTCAPPKSFEGIQICSPGTSASSPVPFHIGAAGQVPMRKVEVWVDGTKKVEQLGGFSNYSFLDSNISMSPGSHKVTVFAAGWDNWLEQKTFTLSVK